MGDVGVERVWVEVDPLRGRFKLEEKEPECGHSVEVMTKTEQWEGAGGGIVVAAVFAGSLREGSCAEEVAKGRG